MGLFEHFPYVNFHQLNIDWILEQMKESLAKIEEFKTRLDSDEADIDQLQADLANVNLNISGIVQDISDLGRQLTRLGNQLADTNSNVSDLQTDMENANTNITEITQDIDVLQDSVPSPLAGDVGKVLTAWDAGKGSWQQLIPPHSSAAPYTVLSVGTVGGQLIWNYPFTVTDAASQVTATGGTLNRTSLRVSGNTVELKANVEATGSTVTVEISSPYSPPNATMLIVNDDAGSTITVVFATSGAWEIPATSGHDYNITAVYLID